MLKIIAAADQEEEQLDEAGHRQVVRNGTARPRRITPGCGTLQVSAPRVNDKRLDEWGARQRFSSLILPPYMRRSPKVAEVAAGAIPAGSVHE